MSHPANIKGWEGHLEDLAKEVENLRYDRLYLFLKVLSEALTERAFDDAKDGRYQLAEHLSDAGIEIFKAKDHILRAWAICQKHMKVEDAE